MAIFNLIFICHTMIRSYQYKLLHIVLIRMTWRIIFVDYILIIIAASGNNLCTYLYSWVVTQPHFKSSKRFYIFQTNALVFISALSFHCFHSKIGKNFTTRNCQFWFYREKTKRVCFILHIRRLKIASQNKK